MCVCMCTCVCACVCVYARVCLSVPYGCPAAQLAPSAHDSVDTSVVAMVQVPAAALPVRTAGGVATGSVGDTDVSVDGNSTAMNAK